MKHGDHKKIAQGARITGAHLSLILHAKARPSWPTAKRLAAATGTDPIVWLEGSPAEIRAAIEKAERERVRRLNEMADAQAEACAGGF